MNNISELFYDLKDVKFQFSLFRSIFHTAWFTLDWWKYLLEKDEYYCVAGQPRKFKIKLDFRKVYCRMRGHAGVWYYTSYPAEEPDMTCKFCDDDLG